MTGYLIYISYVLPKTGENLRRAQLLDTESSKPLSEINASIDGLVLGEAGQESSGESITGTVGVDDLLSGNSVDRVGLDNAIGDDDGGVNTLGDNNSAGTSSVLLGESGDGLGDLGDIGGL